MAAHSPRGTKNIQAVRRGQELSIDVDCLDFGTRDNIPLVGRCSVLIQLHESPPESAPIKMVARAMMWWPGINVDNEQLIRECDHRNLPDSPSHPCTCDAIAMIMHVFLCTICDHSMELCFC